LGGGKYQKKKSPLASALALGHVCFGMGDVGMGEVAACEERSVNVSCNGLVELKKASPPPSSTTPYGLAHQPSFFAAGLQSSSANVCLGVVDAQKETRLGGHVVVSVVVALVVPLTHATQYY
jgi:hypothetical protein